ncbi:MAG: hypothetical protein RL026_1848, partial [Pseudomonadota bacterium]
TRTSGLYPDCKPLNLFGRGNATSAAIDWVTGYEPGQQITTPVYYAGEGFAAGETVSYLSGPDKVSAASLKQKVAEFSMSGELFAGWGAGPISGAFGASWREEEIKQIVYTGGTNVANNDTFLPVPANDAAKGIRGVWAGLRALPIDMQFSRVPNIKGKADVTEFFHELLVPLLADKPFLQQLNFNGGVRWADYSGSGGIWAWKLGLDAQFNDELRLRGTLSRDVRAATLAERFDRTGGAASVRDPFTNTANVGITQVSGGNPNLMPEEADTLTLGAVYRPAWLDGFSASLDWYQVEISGAIGQLTSQDTIDQCFRGATNLCALITRNEAGVISLVEATYQNINAAKVSGIDMEMSYTRPVEWFGDGGRITGRLFATWLGENSTTNAGAAKVDRAGQTGGAGTGTNLALPEYKFTASLNYRHGPLGVYVQGRFIGDGLLDANRNAVVKFDDNTVSSVFYTDMNLSWQQDDAAGRNWRAYLNITNLLDRDPPVVASFSSLQGAVGQTNPALFDLLGRRYVLGVALEF